ncbi:MAG: TrmH family RNA methyltransferase [Clostridiales bacterium]|nr:TrmH family RNA methyltransferase [Clostridiales bacterium]
MVRKYKHDDITSYALGATLVMELMSRRPNAVRNIYISPKSDVTAVTDLAERLGINVVESEKAFNILSPKGNCFVIAEFDKFASHISGDKHHVVLVNPSDSGNLGTIMRNVAAFEHYDLAVIRPSVDPFDPKTVRASMGAVFGINFEMFDSFDDYRNKFGEHAVVPFMLGGKPLSEYNFDGAKNYALVFGNEATGLDRDFFKYGAVEIEQSKNVDSLNLSVAASIGMYVAAHAADKIDKR